MSISRLKKRKLRRRLWNEHRRLLECRKRGVEAEATERQRLIDQYWLRLEHCVASLRENDPLATELVCEIDAVLDLGLTLKLTDYIERIKQLRRPRRATRQVAKVAH